MLSDVLVTIAFHECSQLVLIGLVIYYNTVSNQILLLHVDHNKVVTFIIKISRIINAIVVNTI